MKQGDGHIVGCTMLDVMRDRSHETARKSLRPMGHEGGTNRGLLEIRLKLQGTLLIDFKHQLPKLPTLGVLLEMAKDWVDNEEGCKSNHHSVISNTTRTRAAYHDTIV